MAEKETMNRGWLQTHPDPETGKQQKFAPYTLSENILRRDGSSYESYVNSKINAVAGQMSSSGQATDTKIDNLQGEIDNLELRADALEYKTANIEGADNDTTFYIVGKKTGGTHQIIAKIDQNGVTSVDFINANSSGDKIISLNDLYAKTNGIDSMQGPGILYISDPSGKVIARIDQQGVNSIDFTSYNGTTKITSLNDLLNEVIALKNTTRHMSANDISTTFNSYVNIDQIRTSDNRFIIAGPPNGSNTSNVGFEVNDTGAHAHTFTAKEAVNTKNLTATGNISGISATVTGDINAANANITYNVDASTATIDTASVGTVQSKVYQDGSNSSTDNKFQFVGKDTGGGVHQIIAEVGNNGVKAFDFITADGITLSGVDAGYKAANIAINSKIDALESNYKAEDGAIKNRLDNLEDKTQNIDLNTSPNQTNINGNVTVTNTTTTGTLATDYIQMLDGSGKWYFVDDKSPANIIAQVDNAGVSSIDFTAKDKNGTKITSLIGLKEIVASNNSAINLRVDNVETAYKNADTALKTQIETDYKKADTALKTQIEEDYKDADATINSRIDALESNYKAEDGTIKNRLDNLEDKTQNIDLNTSPNQTNITGNVTVSNTVTAGVLATDQLKMLDGSGKWIFTDSATPLANIIAQVDDAGVSSIDFTAKDKNGTKITSLKDLNNEVSILKDKAQNILADGTDTTKTTIDKDLYIKGNANIGDATTDSHKVTGAIGFAGGTTYKIDNAGNATFKTGVIGDGTDSTSSTTGALKVTGGAAVSKNMYVGANLTVKGNTVLGDASTDTISITGVTTFTGNTTHNGIAYFANGTTYKVDNSGHATFNNLTVKGNTTIGDAATDTISITGATTITGATSIVGNTGITGHLTPGANATYNIGSSSNKWQYLYINKTAYIGNGDDASSTSTGAVQVTGGLSTSKSVYVGTNLTVKGTTTLGDAESDTVSIVGDTTFSNDVVVNKTLNVKGAVTLGDAETDAISIVGDTTFSNDATINKTLTVKSTSALNGAVTIGKSNAKTTLGVYGEATISDKIKAGSLETNQIIINDDVWYFVDKASPANIVAQVDSNGITTTQVRFKDIQSGNLLSTLGFDPSTVESITINVS